MAINDPNILNRLQIARMPKAKNKPQPIDKVGEKKKAAIKEDKATRAGRETNLQAWFNDRHKEMTGKCLHCGERSCKGDAHFRSSIAHILPQRLFPSVTTNPLNWIELCFWAPNSCHTNFDNHILDIMQLNCFDLVIERFVSMYPAIDKKERKNIPDILLQYVKVNQD